MIPLSRPDLGEEELSAIRDVFASGTLGLGPRELELQAQFERRFGHDHAITTGSGTFALDLAMRVLDAHGSEVLVPPITWHSTAFVAEYNGYDVGWVDVDEDTLCMSPDALRKQISRETAAVIPVHYGGQAADIERIVNIAHEHDAVVVEDAAHCPGVEYRGQPVGSIGDIGCFSFQSSKPLTTGQGGMMVTQNDAYAEKANCLVKLGLDKSIYERLRDGDGWRFDVTDVGYRYWLGDLRASIGLVQLRRFEEMVRRRREIASRYRDAFERVDYVDPLDRNPDSTHAWYSYVITVPADARKTLMNHLEENGIASAVLYIPTHLFEVYDHRSPQVPIAEKAWRRIVSLPMSSALTETEVSQVIKAVREFDASGVKK